MLKGKALFNLSKDFTLNILAVAISNGVMQLMLYPTLSKVLSPKEYGLLLTIMGIINVITVAFGDNLCNVRLLENNSYEKREMKGDFQIILLLLIILASIVMAVFCFYFKLELPISIEIIFIIILSIARSYYSVIYRLVINYRNNLFLNITMSVGYVVGVYLLLNIVEWSIVFILANALGLVFIFVSSSIIREPFKITNQFRRTLIHTVILVGSSLISNSTAYMDRFIIYPILGGDSVSTFTVATFFPKLFMLIVTAMTGVVLSYLVKGKDLLTKKLYVQINVLMIPLFIIITVFTMTVGKWITSILYPTLIESAQDYILIGSLGVTINIVTAFASTVVLAYATSAWQVILSIVRCVLYIVTGTILTSWFGLSGMCIASLITNGVVGFILLIVGYINTGNLLKEAR